MSHVLRRFASTAIVAVAITATLPAQQSPTFRTRVDTVDVHATVRAADGKLVSGLTKDDFEIYDNGQRRDIVVFSSDPQPVAISLLLDRSGSIVGQATKVLDAAEAFVGRLMPDDRTAINTLSYECQPLTTNRQKLYDILRKPVPMDLGSPIWAALDRTMTAMADEPGRRAILLFSDGDDDGNPLLPGTSASTNPLTATDGPCHYWTHLGDPTFADVVTRAQRDGVMVYTVSVENSRGATKDDVLRTLAQRSGGDRYRLKQPEELHDAFTRIADELHHQYLLGFAPAMDGRVHEIEVRVKKPDVTIRARKSYVADRKTP
jgi:Ca-activated chloride channel family protein